MSSSSCSTSLQHVLWSAAGEANRKHTVLRCACVWLCAHDQNPLWCSPWAFDPYTRTFTDFFLPFSSFISLLLLNLFSHIKAVLCQEPRTNFSLLPWIIAKCSSFSFFSTWPGTACSHLCCIFHLYMSRHETDQSPPINLQSCFSFFALFHLFHASLCSKRSAQLSFHILFTATHLLCLSLTACPPGTYKPEGAPGGPSTCLPCPDLQHTSQPGSTALSDCVCKPGYRPVGMTCQSEWNWCDIWFTPPGLNRPWNADDCFWQLVKTGFWPAAHESFHICSYNAIPECKAKSYLLRKDWPQLCFFFLFSLLSGGSWPVGNTL